MLLCANLLSTAASKVCRVLQPRGCHCKHGQCCCLQHQADRPASSAGTASECCNPRLPKQAGTHAAALQLDIQYSWAAGVLAPMLASISLKGSLGGWELSIDRGTVLWRCSPPQRH